MSEIQKEVLKALENEGEIQLEEVSGEEISPLVEPVKDKDIAGVNREEGQVPDDTEQDASNQSFESASQFETDDSIPEQEIDEEYDFENSIDVESDKFEIPHSQAKQAADTILGMTNNLLGIAGGFFVKIRKHPEFYEFDQVVQVIDAQNDKNVERIKLDKEDRALLRPCITEVLKSKAKTLTPEQQLMGATLSILMKKTQVVFEVRAENEVLTNRILDIIRRENGGEDTDEDFQDQEDVSNNEESDQNEGGEIEGQE